MHVILSQTHAHARTTKKRIKNSAAAIKNSIQNINQRHRQQYQQ